MNDKQKTQTLVIPRPDPDMGALAAAQELAVAEIEVNDVASSMFAQGFRQSVAHKMQQLDAQRKAITKPLDEAKKQIMDLFRGPVARLEAVIDKCDRKILEFDREQERIAREEQRRLDEAAAKERARLQEIAERAAAKGDIEKAQRFAERAQSEIAPVVASESIKAAGVQFRETWSFQIVDPAKISAAFMVPDTIAIGKVVRALGADALSLVGEGITVRKEKIIAGSRT